MVAIPTNGSDGREQMSGVFDYVNAHPHWEMHIVNTRTDIVNGGLETAVQDADGIILSLHHANMRLPPEFPSNRVKMVVTNDHLVPLYRDRPNCRTLLLDSEAIGRDAARHFNDLGRFAAYGFVHGHIRFPWSVEREHGFRALVPDKMPLFVFPDDAPDTPPDNTAGVIQQERLAAWLAALPKPAAVFGANDLFASEVLAACGRLGLKVPQQVAVLGCDNDPLIWMNTRPQLTSLQLPFRELGYRAAEMLDSLLCGKTPPLRTVRVSGTRLYVRTSSANLPPSVMLVERAKSFIAAHACEGLRARDVAEQLGVSRSLLDLRFRQVGGRTVLDHILSARLDEVKRQLAETRHAILQIGRNCGFNDPDNLKRLFRRRFGLTMRQFRNQSRRT